MRLRRRKLWPRKRRRIRKLRLGVLLLVLTALSLVSFTYGLVTAVASQIPDLDPARVQEREVNGYVYDAKGQRILAVLRGAESRVLVRSNQIAPVMKHAIVAIEDKRFFDHRGVDLRAIGRAFWADVRQKEIVQGGSTITQQFIKNALTENERSIGRKLKEAALAWQLEQDWTKDKILTEYLNTIYFGNGAYGIQQAAKVYFKHGASKLTLPEAALLAAIPRDPSRSDPVTNPRAAKARRALVLRAMLEQGSIAPAAFRKAVRAPLPRPDRVRLPGTRSTEAPYFVNYVVQQLVDKYGTAEVFGGGLRVRTTIDLALQEIGREAIAKWLTDENGPQAALVAVDPTNGDVLAMIGGSNFRESQFNLAVQGERQPGSSFKPFVLASALDQGISPQNTFASKEVDIPFDNKIWHVENYESSYVGTANLETATILSDNSVYAQLTSLVGPQNVENMARRLGIKSELRPYLSIGLGAQAVNPLEMARAFSSFANGGVRVDGTIFGNRPRAVRWVRRQDGETQKNEPDKERVLSPTKTAILNSILQKVISQGTGKAAVLPGFVAAGKTGTTENHGDAWFVGYTPRLAVAVWVGYPSELRPMLTEFNGEPVAGGTYPARIWKAFMLRALEHLEHEPESFPAPSFLYSSPRYVVFRQGRLELDNGNCRNGVQLLVFSGEGPRRTAPCKPNEVDVPVLIRSEIAEARARLAAQPLTPKVVYKPARPGQLPRIVVGQIPKGGTLSAYDEVTLIVSKPLHGVVPAVVGLRLERGLRRLERAELRAVLAERGEDDLSRRIVRQTPAAGVAAAPGMAIRLVLARRK